jgi:competence protein ComEA
VKKGGIIALLSVTLFFCGLVIGMTLGRGIDNNDTVIHNGEETLIDGFDMQPTGHGTAEFLINVNTASADLLDTLPGIGPVLAQRIVDYRLENGPFTSKMDLANVEGLGKAKLLDIYELITVEDSYEDTGSG